MSSGYSRVTVFATRTPHRFWLLTCSGQPGAVQAAPCDHMPQAPDTGHWQAPILQRAGTELSLFALPIYSPNQMDRCSHQSIGLTGKPWPICVIPPHFEISQDARAPVSGFIAKPPQPCDRLLPYILRRRSAVGCAAGHRIFHAKNSEDTAVNQRFNTLHLSEGQIFQLTIPGRRQSHNRAGHVMGLAERQVQLSHKPVCQIGCC